MKINSIGTQARSFNLASSSCQNQNQQSLTSNPIGHDTVSFGMSATKTFPIKKEIAKQARELRGILSGEIETKHIHGVYGDITEKLKILENYPHLKEILIDKPGEFSIAHLLAEKYGELLLRTIKDKPYLAEILNEPSGMGYPLSFYFATNSRCLSDFLEVAAEKAPNIFMREVKSLNLKKFPENIVELIEQATKDPTITKAEALEFYRSIMNKLMKSKHRNEIFIGKLKFHSSYDHGIEIGKAADVVLKQIWDIL